MTKGELIEVAYINIMGGELTQDANVRREDIEYYLPTAVAVALKNSMFQDRAEARAELSVSGFSSFTPSPEFYKEYKATPKKDDINCEYQVFLPALLDLPNNWNVINAYPASGTVSDYIRVPARRDLIGLDNLGPVFYYLTNNGAGTKAVFPVLPEPVSDIVFTIAISPEALEMTDQMYLPPSVENTVIRILEDHFRQQRFNPADPLMDGNDINDSPGAGMSRKR